MDWPTFIAAGIASVAGILGLSALTMRFGIPGLALAIAVLMALGAIFGLK